MSYRVCRTWHQVSSCAIQNLRTSYHRGVLGRFLSNGSHETGVFQFNSVADIIALANVGGNSNKILTLDHKKADPGGRAVCGSSLAGLEGSNPAGGMDVCL